MIHFRTRQDLIEWLGQQDIQGSQGRAVENGSLELLGGFHSVPPKNWPGWIVRAALQVGSQQYIYHVAIVCNGHEYKVINIPEALIPWDQWDGDKSTNDLYRGDNPEIYKEMKSCHASQVR